LSPHYKLPCSLSPQSSTKSTKVCKWPQVADCGPCGCTTVSTVPNTARRNATPARQKIGTHLNCRCAASPPITDNPNSQCPTEWLGWLLDGCRARWGTGRWCAHGRLLQLPEAVCNRQRAYLGNCIFALCSILFEDKASSRVKNHCHRGGLTARQVCPLRLSIQQKMRTNRTVTMLICRA
jgi:hypothetical protein